VKTVFQDSRTGRIVWRMTDDGATSFAPYMYRRAFTHDEKYIVYTSDFSGSFQVWRAELETGITKQLTNVRDFQAEHMVLTMDAAGQEAYLIEGATVLAVAVESGETRPVADIKHLTGGAKPHSFTLTADGRRVLLHYLRATDGRTAIAVAETSGHGQPEEIYAFPADIARITHTLFCPTDPNIVTYNRHPDPQNDMTLSDEERARAWKLNLATGKDVPFLMMPKGFRATHEYWSPDGTRLYFHKKTQPGWIPASIGSMPKDGGPHTIHFESADIKLGHSSVNADQTKIVSDSQEPGTNPLLLIDIATGTAETLCWPNATGAPHPNHVHPAFSPSGRYIIYTSDVSGTAQVYVVPLH
jgi:oligogalacturonide lyase